MADGAHSAGDWFDSQGLIRIARSVARKLRVPAADFGDFIQELRLNVSRLKPETLLNASWIFRVAECRAKYLLRSNARSQASWEALSADLHAGHDPELSHLLAARMTRLPEDVRQILELQLEGYSEREIAAKTSMSRKMVRTRIDWAQRFLGRSPAKV